jgi:uncharacterized protein (DUF2141 family)
MRLALGLLMLLLALAGVAPAHAGDLVIEVSGARDASGRIMVSLWNKSDGFGKFDAGRALATRTVPAAPGKPARVTFEDVAPGRYAVTAFHDGDADGKLKTNFLGMPREGVGVSNNAGGIPSFEKSLLAVPTPGPVSITLRYLGG